MGVFELIQNNTASPNNDFYFRVQAPECLNPSAFGCKIAFYDKNDDLLYYNNKSFAHELNDPADVKKSRIFDSKGMPEYTPLPYKKLIIATWSSQGNIVHILEYTPGFSFSEIAHYHNLFIDLKGQYFVRVKAGIINDEIITALKICFNGFDENKVLEMLKQLDLLDALPLIKDKIRPDNFLQKLIGSNKWYS